MTITKIDVAKLAGVSHMTVTRVLHDSPVVQAATRKKVLAACRRLKYRPNLIARSLRTRKSYAFGILVPTLMHSYYARMISAIETQAGKRGYHVLVAQIGEAELQTNQIAALFGQRVEGLFISTRHCSKAVYNFLLSGGIPVIFLDIPGPKNTVFIGTDDYHGAFEAVNHLIGLGHERIVHLAGRPDVYTAQQRMLGYKAALKAHGIAYHHGDIVFTNYQADGGFRAAEQIVKSPGKYTAIFCANDYIAMGLLSCAYLHGIRVPQQLSVIGFTGDEAGQYSVPPLTTMVQQTERVGTQAVESMLALMENRPTAFQILLKPELLIRQSTVKN